MSCPGRHHDWDETASPPVCKKCGDPKKAAGRPKGSKSRKAGEVVTARLAGTLGVAAPRPRSEGTIMEPPGAAGGVPAATLPPTAAPDAAAVASPTVPAAAPASDKPAPEKPAPSLKPKGWCKTAGKRLARLFDVGTDWLAEDVFHRKPNEADDEDVALLGEGLGEQMAVWFPDAELGPWAKITIAGAAIIGEKLIGAEKIPPKTPAAAKPAALPALSVVRDAPAAATTPPETRPPSSPS